MAQWLNTLAIGQQAVIMDKVRALEENGLVLLGTTMLERIKGNDKDFFELRGGQCRIVLYYDRSANAFVLLHGFLKKRNNEKREIEKARRFLHEYLN